jgi:hypothetical protein
LSQFCGTRPYTLDLQSLDGQEQVRVEGSGWAHLLASGPGQYLKETRQGPNKAQMVRLIYIVPSCLSKSLTSRISLLETPAEYGGFVCESFIVIIAVSRISRSVWGLIGTHSGQGQLQQLVRVGLGFPLPAWILLWLGVCVMNPWFQSHNLKG